jgi:polyisoprenyl-phosphate glycosyltransferase
MALVSIIIPVYYNAASLPALAERLDRLAQSVPQHTFEFVYVDDGSGDNSFAVLCQLAGQDERVRVVRLARNFGSNTAVLAGMTYAKGDCVGFIAADLQDPPETLAEMIARWQAGDKVVLAVRSDRQGDPFLTRVFANLFNFLFKKLVYKDFSPQGVGFFVIDRQVVNFIVACKEKNAHLIGLILWSGYKFSTVCYERVERKHGKSRWTFGKKLKYFIDAFAAFSYLPLRLATFLGLLFAGLGGLYALLLVILRLFNKVPVRGWTAMIVVIIILSGTQLILLGMLGEYLWRTFDAARERPIFVVEEIIENSADHQLR